MVQGTGPRRTTESLSVLVPAYNEGPHVAEALSRLISVLDATGLPYEVLLVSDGSTDDTAAQARRLATPGLEVFEYPSRRGKGYALRHAWERCNGTLIAFFDADLDLHPESLRGLLRLVLDEGADAAIGSKVHPDSQVVYPRLRRIQSRAFRWLVKLRFRLDVSDTQTGIKVFRREVLDAVMPMTESDGFGLDLELLVFANDRNFRIVEGPVDLDFGFSSTTGVAAVLDVLREVRHVARRRRQLRST